MVFQLFLVIPECGLLHLEYHIVQVGDRKKRQQYL